MGTVSYGVTEASSGTTTTDVVNPTSDPVQTSDQDGNSLLGRILKMLKLLNLRFEAVHETGIKEEDIE